ncbi:hypothetical protein F4776DRAFT_396903 [Hypoxylon sp. NC0597]|nr:hypothetical protein F4776DRAFT_396903 [Hypoxylon sp. NC0597]
MGEWVSCGIIDSASVFVSVSVCDMIYDPFLFRAMRIGALLVSGGQPLPHVWTVSDSPSLPCHVTHAELPCLSLPTVYVDTYMQYTVQIIVPTYMASYYMRLHCLADHIPVNNMKTLRTW